jgi:GNAT superfamily N-acetyltransferase
MNVARTFVWAEEDGEVVAYYALAAHQVSKDGLPRQLATGGPRQIPAVLVSKLALDQKLQGKGLGGSLLVDTLQRLLQATEVVAARLLVVDAIDDHAARFYEHFGFVLTAPGSRRLVQKRSDVAAAFS